MKLTASEERVPDFGPEKAAMEKKVSTSLSIHLAPADLYISTRKSLSVPNKTCLLTRRR